MPQLAATRKEDMELTVAGVTYLVNIDKARSKLIGL